MVHEGTRTIGVVTATVRPDDRRLENILLTLRTADGKISSFRYVELREANDAEKADWDASP